MLSSLLAAVTLAFVPVDPDEEVLSPTEIVESIIANSDLPERVEARLREVAAEREVNEAMALDGYLEPLPIVRGPPHASDACMGKLRRGQYYAVEIEAIVSRFGHVEEARVMDATLECLARPAADAVANWYYFPAKREGVAVRHEGINVTIEFAAK